nr:hypothetical protein [Tanacetum cinerariifolium]GFB22321.1 hypothetical protein [Tanacetum cinerariifolium]
MLKIDRLKAQDEEERKKRLAYLSKSDSEYAKQVAQMMETSHAEPASQVPATGPLPSIERQRDWDDMIARFSNTEWMILMARTPSFSGQKKKCHVYSRYRAQQAKPMTRGDTVKFMRTYIKNMSAAYYCSGRTMEWANKFKGDDLIAEYNKIKYVVKRSTTSQGVKRSGPTLEPGSPKKMKSTVGPSLGSTLADESVPADTSIPAVNAPLDEDEPAEESSFLRREYPLEIGVMEQLLDHKLQIKKDPVG